jgi:hypothetical protein
VTNYQRFIVEDLAALGRAGAADPRHIEGYMRLGHPTLDSLSPEEFRMEVEIGLACIQEDGVPAAERNAVSFGL